MSLPRGLILAALACLAAGSLAARVAMADEQPAAADPRPVASNQAISLEDGEPADRGAVTAARAAPPGPAEAEQPVAAAADTEGLSEARTATEHAPPRVSRRPTRSLAPEALAPKAAAWYQTGIWPLAGVMGIIGAGYAALRRWSPGPRAKAGDMLRIVARAAITPKHQVVLIEFGRRFVLAGVSPDNVQALCVIDRADELAELHAQTGAAGRGRADFDRLLARESGAFGEPVEEDVVVMPREAAARGEASPGLAGLLDKLRQMQKGNY